MESPNTQPTGSGTGNETLDYDLPSTSLLASSDILPLNSKAAEVRLPVFDERRPCKDASEQDNPGLLLPESGQHFPITPRSSSSTSSFLASPTLSFSSDQADVNDNLSLSSTELSLKDPKSSPPNISHSDDNTLSDEARHDLKSDCKDSDIRGLRIRGRRDLRNEGFRLARQRYRFEKASKRHHEQQASELSRPGDRGNAITSTSNPHTLRQSKPTSSIESTVSSTGKPIVRLPSQSTMSPPMQSSGRGAGSRGSSSLFGRGGRSYQRLSSRPLDNGPYPFIPSSHTYHPEWKTWQEVSVKIQDLPATTSTRDLYRCFSRQGNIVRIELHENPRGQREGKASVRFR